MKKEKVNASTSKNGYRLRRTDERFLLICANHALHVPSISLKIKEHESSQTFSAASEENSRRN